MVRTTLFVDARGPPQGKGHRRPSGEVPSLEMITSIPRHARVPDYTTGRLMLQAAWVVSPRVKEIGRSPIQEIIGSSTFGPSTHL